MTVAEMTKIIGKVGKLKVEDFIIEVKVNDIRKVYARIDYLVEAVHGSGEKWVSADRVKI